MLESPNGKNRNFGYGSDMFDVGWIREKSLNTPRKKKDRKPRKEKSV